MNLRHICLAVMGLVATHSIASAQDNLLRWHVNLNRGVENSRDSGKPLFVVFRCVR